LIGNGTGNTTIWSGRGLVIYANWVNVSGFTVFDGGLSVFEGGITLYNNNNCTISNNRCLNCTNGICLHGSNDNKILNNNCKFCDSDGIAFISGPNRNNLIQNNNCESNFQNGITVNDEWNVINNNTFRNNSNSGISIKWGTNFIFNNTCESYYDYRYKGIYISTTKPNILKNNTLLNCTLIIEGDQLEHWNMQTIDNSNTVNNNPIYYYKNLTVGSIPTDGSQIILANCSNLMLTNQNLTNLTTSIILGYSNNNTIQNNHVNSSWLYGIWLSGSMDNKVIGNNVDTGSPVGIPGSYKGIRLTDSTNNTITNNIMISRDEDCINGMMIWDSQDNVVRDNTFLSCGFQWYGSYDNVIEENTVNGKPLIYLIGQSDIVVDDAGQVILIYCSDLIVQDLEITNIPKGVELLASHNCIITNITCINSGYGIELESSKNSKVTNNLLINNDHGIFIDDGSTSTVVSNNIVQESLYIGIYSNAAQITIERNQVFDNNRGIMTGGIFALQNTIISNNVTNNWNGILLNSILTTVTQNAITGNVNGIQVCGSSDLNRIISNDISNNEWGINITYEPESRRSNGNWILKNNFIGNNQHACFDSSYKNHWLRNFWEGDILSLFRH